MRITPLDIQNKQFRAARMRGYNADDVDAFLDEIAIEIDGAVKEMEGLKVQLKQLTDQLSANDEMKDTLNAAIINAQKLADEIRGEAEGKAVAILADAQKQSDRLHRDAQKSEQKLLKTIDDLRKTEESFRSRFTALLEEYLSAVKSGATLAPDTPAPAAAAPETPDETGEPRQEAAPLIEVPQVEGAQAGIPQIEMPPPDVVQVEPAAVEPPAMQPEFVQEVQPPVEEAADSAVPRHLAPDEELAAAVEAAAAAEPEVQIPEIALDVPAPEAAAAEQNIDLSEMGLQAEPAPPAEIPETMPEAPIEAAPEAPIEAAPEIAVETPVEQAPAEAAPAAEGGEAGIGESVEQTVVDDVGSKDEIAEAVERMRRMLGEAGIDTPAAGANGSGEESPAAEPPADAGDFSDLGEGVPGVRKKKDQGQERGFGSEVD